MKIDISILLEKINENLDENEEVMFQNWLAADERHRDYFENLKKNMAQSSQKEIKLRKKDKQRYRKQFINRLRLAGRKEEKSKSLTFKVLFRVTVAASLVLLIVSIPFFIEKGEKEAPLFSSVIESLESPIDLEKESSLPIEKKHKVSNKRVRLITAKGEQLSLEEMESSKSLAPQSFKLNRDKKGLTYSKKNILNKESTLNTLVVERGAEFHITLSDGTKIHLNSDSRLKYPTSFNEKERRVYLEGEAYFEVAKNVNKPFIVCSGLTEVEVVGTQFNVNSRNPESIKTTLVLGSVIVKSEKIEPVQLKPGFTAVLNPIEGILDVGNKDIRCYIGWKTGDYLFESTPLSDILNELAIWYDLTIDYQTNEADNEIFTGSLSRNLPIANLIQLIEQTNYLNIELKNKTLIVKDRTI
ncbi:MAG TPA: hypothetical protein DDZ96_07530 [Porphyromonadaceae bacterium]|jgi:ferric-dicitrate binding protein FerR (iron transport regulator)|nr:hypothetical protein [Porphyromonadaceae bacterium]HBX20815.1 hypothetical protein [Porphyromonadaceae bacterium]HCM20132.1 hypothetical protein [Porphyromonadaceae bacterium]